MSEIIIIGMPELREKMGQMTDAVTGEALMTAATSGAKLIETQAKINVPKRTGNLARSMHTLPVHSSRNSAVVSVGTNVEYAAMIEFGYVGPQDVSAHFRTIKEAFGRPLRFPVTAGVRAHVRQINRPAQPYLRPALDSTRGAVVAEISAVLRAIVGGFAS
jgi:HK97 gp10 family phage protein